MIVVSIHSGTVPTPVVHVLPRRYRCCSSLPSLILQMAELSVTRIAQPQGQPLSPHVRTSPFRIPVPEPSLGSWRLHPHPSASRQRPSMSVNGRLTCIDAAPRRRSIHLSTKSASSAHRTTATITHRRSQPVSLPLVRLRPFARVDCAKRWVMARCVRGDNMTLQNSCQHGLL